MLCKRCNNELPENSRFCMACGALQPMICPSCQSESRPGSRVCSGCGKKLPVSFSGLTFYKRKKTPAEIAATVLLILGALLVLSAAVMFLVGTLSDVAEPETSEQVVEADKQFEEEEFTVVVEAPITKPMKDPNTVKPEEETPSEEEEDLTQEDPAEEKPEEEPEEEPEEQPEEETPEQTKPSVSDTEYFFPDSSERILTDADVAGLSKAELQIARNEIYARHGRKFKNPDLQAWFNSCSWYKGTIEPAAFDESSLSDVELANVYFLKEKENG